MRQQVGHSACTALRRATSRAKRVEKFGSGGALPWQRPRWPRADRASAALRLRYACASRSTRDPRNRLGYSMDRVSSQGSYRAEALALRALARARELRPEKATNARLELRASLPTGSPGLRSLDRERCARELHASTDQPG